MFALRSATNRLLCASSASSLLAARSRTFVTLTPAIFRQINQQPPSPQFVIASRRWNSDVASKSDQLNSQSETDSLIIDSAIGTAQIGESAQRAIVEEDAQAEEIASNIPEAAQSPERPSVVRSIPGRNNPFANNAAAPFQPARSDSPLSPKETVYVGNLFFDVTAEDLKDQFERFGVVESTKIIHDNRGLSKGFGYVSFDSVDSATRAIEGMHLQIYEGRRMVVNYAMTSNTPSSREPQSPSKTLYIGNLAWDMTDRDLNDLFADIRNVIDVRVAVDRATGQPRGFAHADFLDVKSAQEAYEVLSNKAPHGRKLRVDYSISNKSTGRRRYDSVTVVDSAE